MIDILVWNVVHSHDSCNHDRDSMNYYGGGNKVYSDDDTLQQEHDDGNTLVRNRQDIRNYDTHIRNHRS